MLTITDIETSIAASAKSAIQAQIDANGKTGWSQSDSAEAIFALCEAWHDALATIDGEPEPAASALREAGKTLILDFAKKLANSSQFRQMLEKAKRITPAPEGAKRRSSATDAMIAGLV